MGESKYRGLTLGLRKRFSNGFQLDANYVWSKDKDTDSNERDPFTDRSFDISTTSTKDWGYSDRDIRHRFNLYGYVEVGPVDLNVRWQTRSAQPITANPRVPERRRPRTQQRAQGQRVQLLRLAAGLAHPPRRRASSTELVPMIEMFNTFNNDNNINPLSTPALFNFDGFLRTGVGDPRQLQYAIKFVF